MVWILLVLVCSAAAQQGEPFRKELFPEQLQQQALQFAQGELQFRLQDLQRQLQGATGAKIAELLQEQANIQRRLVEIQQEQIQLQEAIQRQLGNPVTFARPQQPSQQPSFQPQPQPSFQPQPQPAPQPQPRPEQPQRQFPPSEFAPEDSDDFVLPCTTLAGEEGLCRPLVKCLGFYADLPDLRKQPCQLRADQLGVCCPRRSRPQATRQSGVLQAPPRPRVAIPQLSPQQLNQAATQALENLRERFNFVASLFAQGVFVRPNTPSAWHLEFFPTTNETLDQGDQAQKNVEASTALVNQFNLSPDQGRFGLPEFSVLDTVIGDTCPRRIPCRSGKYRTIDGSCNNLQNSGWGQAGTALQRILPPKYADGVNAPRSRANDGSELPSARLVSTQFAQDFDASSENYTTMVMQWGQFLDHDLTHTPITRGSGGSGISCCRDGNFIEDSQRHPDCFAIGLPRNDHIFAPFGERCMEFTRSLPAPRPQCNFGPREQMNQITGWLDGSNVYGSNVNSARSLREGRGGRLRIQNVRGRSLLPANPDECTDDLQQLSCFQAGDGRVNEQVDLALMHTVWVREHNRIAGGLAFLHPEWSDEALYQEARRIVVAEIQHITYNEFLPIILGQSYMDKFSLRPKDSGWTRLYDPQLNGGITNVFATAAFRFGHSLIQSNLHGYGRFGNLRQNLRMSKQHFAPFDLYKEGAMDDFIRGLSAQRSQSFDRFFSRELTDHLFQGDLDIGLDLVALNIQRGRDHGLPPYNEWREVCGLPRINNWQDLVPIMGQEAVSQLARLYPSVDEIDLFVGAVAEGSTPGSMLGPTFVCLVGDQFARLRRADRFFYEEGNQPSSFSEEQLKQIRKTSLARVLCDNSDDMALMQPLVFIQPSFLNQRVACDSESIPSVDLRAWAFERPAA